MSDDQNMPLHEQVYHIVKDGQEAEKRRANAWQGGTNYGRSSLAAYGGIIGAVIAAFAIQTDGFIEMVLAELAGVLLGAGIAWACGKAFYYVFIFAPLKALAWLAALWRKSKA